MATLDGFAIQQVLHALPDNYDSYVDTMLDFSENVFHTILKAVNSF